MIYHKENIAREFEALSHRLTSGAFEAHRAFGHNTFEFSGTKTGLMLKLNVTRLTEGMKSYVLSFKIFVTPGLFVVKMITIFRTNC